jgi:hypothetical protein
MPIINLLILMQFKEVASESSKLLPKLSNNLPAEQELAHKIKSISGNLKIPNINFFWVIIC